MTDRKSRTGPGEEPGDASQERPSESYDATRSELKKLAAIAVSLETLLDSMQNVVDGSDSESFIFRAAFERLTIREISKLVERCFRSESSSAHAAHGLLANVHTTLEDAYKEATAFEDRGQRERARHVMYLKGWKRVHGTACKDLNRSLAGLKTEIARKDPSRDGYLRDARRARDAKRRREFHRIENTAGRNSLLPNERLEEVTLVDGSSFLTLRKDEVTALPEGDKEEHEGNLVTSTPAPEVICNRLIRDGDTWEITFRGKTNHLRHLQGLQYLNILLSTPGRGHEAHKLRAEVQGKPIAEDATRVDPVADPDYIRQCKKRIEEIEEEMEELERFKKEDTKEYEELDSEKREIQGHLVQMHTPAGRVRQLDGAFKKHVDNVRSNTKNAIGKIGKQNPELAEYLTKHVRFGRQPRFDPPDGDSWDTGMQTVRD